MEENLKILNGHLQKVIDNMKINPQHCSDNTCQCGRETLIEIIRKSHGWDDTEEVVRWCTYCGSVVCDVDYDGRVLAGKSMKMRKPETFKQSMVEN